ncbi:MAG: hypothetical protein ACE5D7_03545 [Fidelibacterota bacterium]
MNLNQIRAVLIGNFTLVSILSVLFFFYPNVLGEDLYYHLKLSLLIKNSGFSVIRDMNWFQLTTWSLYPADLSLGFHLLLIPFLSWFSPIVSIKILGIILILLLTNIFYFMLASENVKYIIFWLFLMLFVSTFFLYRLSIVRPFLISITFSLLIFYSIVKGQHRILALTCFLYPSFYTGWIQIFIILFFYLVSNLLLTRHIQNKRVILISIIFVLGGLILRPDFPNILILTYQQVFELLLLNFKGLDLNVGIGQRIADIYFFQDNIISILLFASTLLLNFFNFKYLADERKKITLLSLSFITLFYFVWSLESIRFIEYWIPFTILFAALSFTYFTEPSILGMHSSTRILSQIPVSIRNSRFWKVLFGLLLIAISYHSPLYVLKSIKNSKPITTFRVEAQWMEDNTDRGANIFITSWDSFSRLFYYNHHNRYTVGMDPVFFYLRDPDRFWLWRNITEHNCVSSEPVSECPDGMDDPVLIARTIRSKFESDYIFTNNYSVYYPFVKMMATHPEIFHFIMSGDNSFLFSIDPDL